MQLLSLLKELSLHPKNAEELKGLILQLAVQGKLTAKWREENPNVELASELIKKIEEEKKKLIKEKKIKKEKPFTEISDEEIYFTIPKSWAWERLGAIGNIFNGDSINKSVKEAKYEGLDEGFPYIATKDVGYGFEPIDHDNGVRIPFDEPKFKTAKKGTVLICSEGGSAGKKMGLLEEECCFGNKLYALEQYGNIESVYILSLYGSSSFSRAFTEKMTGIIGGISRNNFADLLIPIPPLEEQKAIVDVVNQLFAEVEQLEELTKERISLKEDFVTSALSRLTSSDNTASEWNFLKDQFSTFFTETSNVKKLRETILQLAVQGKLTSKWRANNPNIEPASELLKRIEAEKQQLIKEKKIKKKLSTDSIILDNATWDKPENWLEIELQNLFNFIDYRGKTPKKSESGKRLITAKNIRMGYIKNEPVEFVSNDFYDKWMVRGFPRKGDVLFVTEGHTMGFACQIELDYEFALAQRTICLQSFHNFDNTFFYYTILSTQFQNIVIDNQTGSAAGGIKASKLKRITLPVPPLEEQQAIVEKVNSLMALCDELEQQIETSHTQVEQLMQSCLKEVFETDKVLITK